MSEHDPEIQELRQRIEKLENKIAFLFKNLQITYPDEVNPKIIELLKQGKKIEAITLYRRETGVDLNRAKAFVEAIEV
jgi:ribosomal protein L7/L12